MKLIIASNNKDKIKEIKEILSSHFDEIISIKEAGIHHETIEDGTTFMENAIKKAKEICEISGCASLADDSGICVDALGGEPGIYSARYSGEHGNDEMNNQLILKNLEGKTDRSAHYTCAMALFFPDGKSITAEGYWHGKVAYEPKGINGFGYDPLFIPDGFDCTSAELTPEEKNDISHRRNALNLLLKKLS
ncbi:MAG: RdgB/HAM1 family non-canonical purine NTP pyrophosphatase [Ruminococcaceae bacterium]|nr:RdgB/HAM1 family non-canonical purine NTP pyrophosphatase [Oscillospiraceae bacterium]